jgi:hypothetical protein
MPSGPPARRPGPRPLGRSDACCRIGEAPGRVSLFARRLAGDGNGMLESPHDTGAARPRREQRPPCPRRPATRLGLRGPAPLAGGGHRRRTRPAGRPGRNAHRRRQEPLLPGAPACGQSHGRGRLAADRADEGPSRCPAATRLPRRRPALQPHRSRAPGHRAGHSRRKVPPDLRGAGAPCHALVPASRPAPRHSLLRRR